MVSPIGDPGAAANDGYPDFTPPPLTPEAERTEKGARNLLTSWARAIEMDEAGQAWAMMGRVGKAKWTEDQFENLFDDLGAVTVDVRGGQMEGAAGSSFYTVPTVITATDKAGKPVRFTGELVLRRVNDVPGATPEQLRWHFESVTLNRAK